MFTNIRIPKKEFLIILLVSIVGLYLRSGSFFGYFAFTFDQGRDFLIVHDLVYNRNLTLIGPPTGPVDGVFHGVWWYWFLAPLLFVSGGSPWGVAVLFSLVASLSIPIAYAFGKAINGWGSGIVFASLAAFSPSFIGTASQVWNPNLIPTLTIVLLVLLWRYQQKKVSFMWIGLLAGLIFELHLGFGSFLTMAVLFTLVVHKLLPGIKDFLLAGGGFLLWTVPRIIFDLRNNFLQWRSFMNYISSGSNEVSLSFVQRLQDRASLFFSEFTNSFTRNELLSVLLLGYMGYVFITLKDKTKKKYIGIVLGILCALFLMFSVYPRTLWSHYAVGLSALFWPLMGVFLSEIVKQKKLLASSAVVIYMIYLVAPWNFFKPAWEGDAAVYKNQLRVVDEVYSHSEGSPFNVQVYSPSVIDYNYQYLFLWYGKKTYGYIPDREGVLSQVFHIIEPDPWNKGLRDIWIRERVGDGETVWQTTLPGNIEVVHRQRKQS